MSKNSFNIILWLFIYDKSQYIELLSPREHLKAFGINNQINLYKICGN